MEGIPTVLFKPWQDCCKGGVQGGEQEPRETSFPVDEKLNGKIFLWKGASWKLDVDAVVINGNESLTDRGGMNQDIFQIGGEELEEDCLSYGKCRTGDAIITRAGYLPCSRLIHTVTPRYSEKYDTAAENAMYHCVRSAMRLALENKLRKVAISVIYPERKKYPPDKAAHVVIRTVRRFLEHYRDAFDQVIFCFETEEVLQVFEAILCLYFPRTAEEEVASSLKLKAGDIGNEWGEKIVEERKIRVNTIRSSKQPAYEYPEPLPPSPSSTPFAIAPNTPDFVEMVEEHDKLRVALITKQLKNMPPKERQEFRYKSFVQQSLKEDLQEYENMGLVYKGGYDNSGRCILVALAGRLMNDEVDFSRLLLYVVGMLESVSHLPYSIVYLHEGVQEQYQPTIEWVTEVVQLVSRRYSENLRTVYIVRPTWWVKVLLWGLSFTAEGLWPKLVYVENLQELYGLVDPKCLNIPKDLQREQITYHEDLAVRDRTSSSASVYKAQHSEFL